MRLRKVKISAAFNPHNKVQLIHGGKPFFDLLESLINQAAAVIHLQTYVIEEDTTGKRILKVLMAAARRGVKVFILCDGYATRLTQETIDQITEAGVHFRYFEPFFSGERFYFGRRLHHKVFVADNFHALVGGINIADRYNDTDQATAWMDFALYVQGQSSEELHQTCSRLWKRKIENKALPNLEKKVVFRNLESSEMIPVRVRRNDRVRGRNQITRSYAEFIGNAGSTITIISSYFLPGNTIRLKLANAAKKGVKVRVILAGISDIKLSKYAERYLYNWLLRKQIEIFEYQPTVLHAKAAVFDSTVATIGSYNINNLSALASIELNLDVKDAQFAACFRSVLDKLIAEDCKPVSRDDLKRIRLFSKIKFWLAYQIVRLLLFLFTANLKQEKGLPNRQATTSAYS